MAWWHLPVISEPEVDSEGSKVQGHLRLYIKFYSRLKYMTLRLKGEEKVHSKMVMILFELGGGST